MRMRKKHKLALFSANVRYSLGKNKRINASLIETAKQSPDDFYYLNNGITITCDEFKSKESANTEGNFNVCVTKAQIINGAQTVNSIYMAFEEALNEKKRKNKKVLNTEEMTAKLMNTLRGLKLCFD
ncbi:MAG: hypothetical protein GY782_10525 [Gammaproteobacteria bacterium]|nr:hypothetical protein [Gammaproteobacteria bacterium]